MCSETTAPYFSAQDLEKIRGEYRNVAAKYQDLLLNYVARPFVDAKAREYATQGFPRRLKILARCIHNVFEILPPDRTALPTSDELSDAEINVQAFVFNAFGSIDNLAWIWVREKSLTRKNGTPLPNTSVGLGKKSTVVRSSFSAEFRAYLESLDVWFDNLESFRHALGHRIPLYIPPYVLPADKKKTYQELEHRMAEAVKRLDFSERERLSVEQTRLAVFTPWMTHSFEEKAKIVVFHAQLLADFNTVAQLGQKLLQELNR